MRERPAARRRAFIGRAQVDEERDEGQHRHVDKSVEPHANGQHAAGPSGDARGFVFRFQPRENGAQHAAAVHGKCGQQIESGQDQIGQSDAVRQIRIDGCTSAKRLMGRFSE